jgi:hypothetical protein
MHRNWISFYYLGTPLFVLLDLFFGLSFRISGLGDPADRFAYYGLCIACALGVIFRPQYSSLIALGESSVNLLILLLSVMLPIIYLGNLESGGTNPVGLDNNRLLNFLLSGSILLTAFYSAQHKLMRAHTERQQRP